MLNHRELKLLGTLFSFGLTREKLEIVKNGNALKQPLMPMGLVLDTPQTPARKDKIFILQHNVSEGYSITPLEGSSVFNPPLNGRFLFVILASDPARIYCGVAYDPINQFLYDSPSSPGKIAKGSVAVNNVFDSLERCEVEGHTSLTQYKDVLFAGDLLFRHGELIHWTNASGHYQPRPDSRHTNLYPNIKRILPERLFEAFDFEALSTGARGSGNNSYRSGSSQGLSDYSNLSSFGSNGSKKSGYYVSDNG